MKRKGSLVLAFLSLASFLSSCDEVEVDKRIAVTIVDNPAIKIEEKHYLVNKGDNLEINFEIVEGFTFSSCSYSNYDVLQSEPFFMKISLKDIQKPMRLEIVTTSNEYGIVYNLNGGSFKESAKKEEAYFVFYDLEHHKRANTDLGLGIEREGYLLTGWNTQKDLQGEHISLGSRVTIVKGEILPLYAEWVKEDAESLYSYQIYDDGVKITGYLGSNDSLVIPSKINGKEVTSINGQFLTGKKIKNLILPPTIESFASNSIVNCEIENMTIYDSLRYSYSDSLNNTPLHRLYINARIAPRFQKDDDIARFADDMDSLIIYKDRKKMLLYAGCSFPYGVFSNVIEENLPSYKVLNMGVIGGSTSSFAYEAMARYLKEDDLFIHAPEVSSAYQFMARNDAESRMFVQTEGNYDIISYSDISNLTGVFGAFGVYQNMRAKLEEGSYSDYLASYNDYGDITYSRPFTNIDKKYQPENTYYTYDLSLTTENVIKELVSYYNIIKNKGATVYFSFSPVNENGLPQEDVLMDIGSKFEENIRKNLTKYNYKVISTHKDYLYKGRYFYDTDYHLNESGASLRTNKLIKDIKAALNGGNI